MAEIPYIDETKTSTDFEQIHHYTNLSNLDDILKSGGLLATDYEKTNDKTEMVALGQSVFDIYKDDIKKQIFDFIENNGLYVKDSDAFEEAMNLDMKKTCESIIKASPSKPYIACFSKHYRPHHSENGLLTMWRSYTHGNGIALSFNTRAIVDLTEAFQKQFNSSFAYIDHVMYGLENSEMNKRIDAFSYLPNLISDCMCLTLIEGAKLPDKAKQSLLPFLILSCCTKHPDFEDEREIRLIIGDNLTKKEGKEPQKRINGRILFPCIDALEEIIVGPNENIEKNINTVNSLLEKYSLSRVRVKPSATPFRDIGSLSNS